jgi:hypothetical protein
MENIDARTKKNQKRLRIAKRLKSLGQMIKTDDIDTDEIDCMDCEDKKMSDSTGLQVQI